MADSQPSSRIAIGQMSGTSLDGIDIAIIETTPHALKKRIGAIFVPYPKGVRESLHTTIAAFRREKRHDTDQLSDVLTQLNIDAIKLALEKNVIDVSEVDVIGFHGQTIWHNPAAGETIQLGDGARIAQVMGIDVVYDFRSNDIANGGQGAPLVPLYHQAIFQEVAQPVIALNIGGVANLTYIDKRDNTIIAFDCGPGNVLIDDAVRHFGMGDYDKDGAIADMGSPSYDWVDQLLQHRYFAQPAPKSLDRMAFSEAFENLIERKLSVEDTIASATFATAAAVKRGLEFFPSNSKKWILCGGGRHNPTLVQYLADALDAPMFNCDDWGLNGDTLEAEAFAYLAVRSLEQLPLSLPSTTGCREACSGGIIARA